MIDFGIDKLALIGAVALIVIGPEKLPRVARTVGVLLGKAQRYVSQVQSEVSRSMELEELKKVKAGLEEAARDVGQSVEDRINEARDAIYTDPLADHHAQHEPTPYYSYGPPVRKNWRLKRGATPLWYKQRQGVRRQVQSGAARVARFRPGPR
ncbi:MAG: Sec-independent protein translocase subunit TatB [Aquabacterium sp.]|uniref:Sec-independent protein translocase subunit TatA/TatB n=1 Tax=Aquabacterium sp. TaxID=1872578 RepID=UPI0025C5FE8B|nr:twin-arginine translocase TatA/TatE family subunit [Aquabacterium sp.]MBI3380812.1 Sec-independent protein translocase subunit TatB [Aquabacterium sp.]